jgi:PLP dependent protein
VDHVRSNLAAVRERIAAAARASGRQAQDIRLIAVSKTFPQDAVRAAYDAGQRDFGENKVQEALQKQELTAGLDIRWHLIGHLQSNKVKRAAAAFAAIHSIDSVDLLERVDAAAVESGARPDVFLQVDLAGEATKFGAPEAELDAIVGPMPCGPAGRTDGAAAVVGRS